MADVLERIVKDSWNWCLERGNGIIAYKPDGAVRTLVPQNSSGMSFHVLYNPQRDNRRRSKGSTGCPLCENVIDKKHGLMAFGSYTIGPNGWPINPYHTVITLNKRCPEAARQGKMVHQDLADIMEYSSRSGQFIIYNTFGAAATAAHQHFQGFTCDEPISKLTVLPLSEDGRVLTMPDYPGANFVFYGKDAIPSALDLIEKIRALGDGHTYTALIRNERLTVIPRRVSGQTPDCTKKMIGGFECAGYFVVGNISDADGNILATGQEVFFKLCHDDLENALKATTLPKDHCNWYARHLIWGNVT